VLSARATRLVGRFIGRGGTSLPGLVAARVDPTVAAALAADLGPVILTVGTNGKTTTARLIGRILLAAHGSPPIANRSGANLQQGIASSLLAAAAVRGGLRERGRAAVFEVDELALDGVLEIVRPTAIVATNLFRDQLDRYGEVDMIVERWSSAFARIPTTTLAICADDPRLEQLATSSGLRTIRFGLDPGVEAAGPLDGGARPAPSVASEDSVSDPVSCPTCGTALVFTWHSIAHLGDYACPNGHFRRPAPDVSVSIKARDAGEVGTNGTRAATRYAFVGAFGAAEVSIHLAGVSGAYDAAAAVAAAMAIGIEPGVAIGALEGATPAFGRLEEVRLDDRRIVLALAKNPASLTESEAIAAEEHPDGILLGLSDEPADGRDVSWIWDVDFDALSGVPWIGLTGTRADDLALRFKYSARSAGRWPIVATEPLVDRALEAMLPRIPRGGTLIVLATYTAMLGIRKSLHRRGVAPAIPT